MHMSNLSSVIAGLREHRDGLAERLEKLETTIRAVTNELEAVDGAMASLVGAGRPRPSLAAAVLPAAPPSPPHQVVPVGNLRNVGLARAVCDVLRAAAGSLSTDEVLAALPSEYQSTEKRSVRSTLSTLKRDGVIAADVGPIGPKGRPLNLWWIA